MGVCTTTGYSVCGKIEEGNLFLMEDESRNKKLDLKKKTET